MQLEMDGIGDSSTDIVPLLFKLAGRYAVLLPLFFKFLLLLLLLLFQKKSRNLNLNSRYGTIRRPALLVVAS